MKETENQIDNNLTNIKNALEKQPNISIELNQIQKSLQEMKQSSINKHEDYYEKKEFINEKLS